MAAQVGYTMLYIVLYIHHSTHPDEKTSLVPFPELYLEAIQLETGIAKHCLGAKIVVYACL